MVRKKPEIPVEEDFTSFLPGYDNKIVPFSVSYLDWLDTCGFHVNQTWDSEKDTWGAAGKIILADHQRRILSYALAYDENTGRFPYTTILYSCIKKSGKTALAASVGAWYSEQAPPGSEIYVLANDLEQAEGRIMKDIKFHALRRGWDVTQYKIELPNGTTIQSLAQSYKSVAGARHALTLFDELWGIQQENTRRTYEEMTPISTIPHSLRFIATYAGYINESDLLWDLYSTGVGEDEYEGGQGQTIPELADLPCWKTEHQFTYWDSEPRLPWQTEQYYREQRATLRPAAYLRLHENQWVTSKESFIAPEVWDAACDSPNSSLLWKDHPMRLYPVIIGVDGSINHDCTVVVGVVYEPKDGSIHELFHKIWTPTKDSPMDFDVTIESFLLEMNRWYKILEVTYDPAHIHQTMTRLKQRGLPCEPLMQTTGNMTRVGQNLYDLLVSRKFHTYKDDEARQHVLNTVAQADPNGFRLVKSTSNNRVHKPVDYTIALAMAAYRAVSHGGVEFEPIYISAPFADMNSWREKKNVPWMFSED